MNWIALTWRIFSCFVLRFIYNYFRVTFLLINNIFIDVKVKFLIVIWYLLESIILLVIWPISERFYVGNQVDEKLFQLADLWVLSGIAQVCLIFDMGPGWFICFWSKCNFNDVLFYSFSNNSMGIKIRKLLKFPKSYLKKSVMSK